AIICVALILTMITINLGQLGVYKTDVSVAADSAALAGVSVLSGALLGLGLTSDSMCGKGIIMILSAVAATLIPPPVGEIIAISILFALLISEITSYIRAWQDGMMAWSNAKKTALQYAFQNAGVDEPRPSFKAFMNNVKGYYGWGGTGVDELNAQQVQTLYTAYFNGDDSSHGFSEGTRRAIRNYSQNGFYRFMSADPLTSNKGYWPLGDITPLHPHSQRVVTSGFGWGPGPGPDGTTPNSFDMGIPYNQFENYVEVSVSGMTLFPLEPWNGLHQISDMILNAIRDLAHSLIPWWLWPLEWIVDLLIGLVGIILDIIFAIIPFPLGLSPINRNMKLLTDDSPLRVEVRRYKKDIPLGLWTFKYKSGVSSVAMAHTFCENGYETIEPTGLSDLINLVQNLINTVVNGGSKPNSYWGFFDTSKHLFETQLIYAH
ncbi:MAG: Tad domain-containing protein, partial [Candidatus Omnitrophica bacterium]|nr:Tad domain-containing protein [Candidatus Omnitrophota bacterium]